MADLSEAAPWTSSPRVQLALGGAAFALVALVTIAPVIVVVVGAFDGNVWRETFLDSPYNRNAIFYSFLLGAARADRGAHRVPDRVAAHPHPACRADGSSNSPCG